MTMAKFDWERDRTKNAKGSYHRASRTKREPGGRVDHDWENPDAANKVPYVWEPQGDLRQRMEPGRHRVQLQELNRPVDDGLNPLRIFFNIFGRLNRGAYVKRWFALIIITSIPTLLLEPGSSPFTGTPLEAYHRPAEILTTLQYIAIAIIAVLYIASKTLQIRRLHDLNLSGIWIAATIAIDAGVVFAGGGLWYLSVILAVLYNFIFIYFYGTFGPNNYGPDPILRELGDEDFITSSRFGWYYHSWIMDIIEFVVVLFLRR